MFDCPSLANHQQGFLDSNDGDRSAIFTRASALAYDLAVQTGGLFCPLMNPGRAQDYVDHDSDYAPGGDCPHSNQQACCQAIFDGDAGTQSKTPCVFRNDLRGSSNYQRVSVDYLPKQRQAAACAQTIVTSNPYMQEIPLKICLNGQPCTMTDQ